MSFNDILLTVAAVLPAIVLCVYVYKKDRAEKEPVPLLLILLALGGISCFPAAKIERVVINLIQEMFAPYGDVVDGVRYLDTITFRLYHACRYFVGVALVEEGLKFLVLILVTRRSKEFNSLFDGLIYAIFVSLGFAAVENVLYVLKYGWMNALMRAVLSVPAHMFFGVLMGYYYSFWHMYELAKQKEQALKNAGLINRNAKELSSKKYLPLCLVIPILAHGLYDYCCTLDTVLASFVFYALIFSLYFYCFGKISKMSDRDVKDTVFSNRIISKRYPHLGISLINQTQYNPTDDAQSDQ